MKLYLIASLITFLCSCGANYFLSMTGIHYTSNIFITMAICSLVGVGTSMLVLRS